MAKDMTPEQRTRGGEPSAERYRLVFQSAPDGILILHAGDGRIAEVNPAAAHLLGAMPEHLLGKPCAQAGLFHDSAGVESTLGEIREKGACRPALWRIARHPERRVEVAGARFEEGGRQLVQITLREVSARTAADPDMMEALARISGKVAHDFNNYLTTIIGYGELLAAGVRGSEKLAHDAEQIQHAARNAADLGRKLLAFGRKARWHPKYLNLNDLLQHLRPRLEELAGGAVALEIRTADNLASVRVDAAEWEQALLNLVANAREATPPGGTIMVESAQDGPWVILRVSDTGRGMDEEALSRAFEPFFSTKPKALGTGLGLSIVYGVVRQSAGSISIRSRPGQGTVVEARLPACEEARREAEVVPANPARGRTVLLVEDEEAVRNLVREILAGAGYRVVVAADGHEALRLAGQSGGECDLLLTDVILPRMNGHELAQRIMPRIRSLKVLYMSGHSDEVVVREGTGPESAFLAKPFTPNELLRAVRRLLDPDAGGPRQA